MHKRLIRLKLRDQDIQRGRDVWVKFNAVQYAEMGFDKG